MKSLFTTTLFTISILFCSAQETVMETVAEEVTNIMWYHENGKKSTESFFMKGERAGMSKWFYEDAAPEWMINFKNGKRYYGQYWTKDGKPQLTNGTGLIATRDAEFPGAKYMEIKDSLFLRQFEVTDETRDTVYTVAEVNPMFKGGMGVFNSLIAKSIVYPKTAIYNEIHGRVLIEFLVDQQGNAIEAKVIKGIGSGCDEAALVAFNKQKGWMPATYQGKPVKMKIILPIEFKLEN